MSAKWNPRASEAAKAWRRQGLSAREIQGRLEREYNEIRTESAVRMHLRDHRVYRPGYYRTEEERDRIRDLVRQGYTRQQIADYFTRQGTPRTLHQISWVINRYWLYKHGPRRPWTETEILYLKRLYFSRKSGKEMVKLMGARFKMTFTESQIQARIKRLKWAKQRKEQG